MILEDLKKETNDSDLDIPDFDPSDPDKMLSEWAGKLINKYDEQIKARMIGRFNSSYVSPQKLWYKMTDKDSGYEEVHSIVHKSHPANLWGVTRVNQELYA